MYGATDPNDAEGARWRQDPPTGDPAWLTDQPEPRSTYLFGDEPGNRRPADPYQADPYQAEPTDRPWAGQPTARWEQPGNTPWREEPTGRWQPAGEPQPPEGAPMRPAAEPWRDRPTGQWHPGPVDGPPTRPIPIVGRAASAAGGQRVDLAARQSDNDGRRRRFPRPLLIGGAAAAATLVVSLGVGALTLPGGDEQDTTPTADTIAAAPIVPGDVLDSTPASPAASPSPSASPTSARPSPTPSRTVKPTPRPDRSTAASRVKDRNTTAPTASRSTAAPTGTGSQTQQVVTLVNAERAKAGCGALKVNSKLTAAAQAHSQDQADHQEMAHKGSDGSELTDRLARVGYAWSGAAENVAWGQKTPAAVMDAWMKSSGHRTNILNCSYTEIGVGVATNDGPYWTQVFGTPR